MPALEKGEARRTLRRIVIGTITVLINVAGFIVAIGAALWYYDNHRGWYVGLVARSSSESRARLGRGFSPR